MLGRLKRRGFTEAERMGAHRGKTVVRAYHPAHGWMYEKIDETDEAACDAAADQWAVRAVQPIVSPRDLWIGAVKE
jgi:hypothetical protein